MVMKNTSQLVKKLRSCMKNTALVSEAIQAYIIPSGDAHQSEYVAERDNRRAFISNFTGSAGTAIITMDEASLWTDGRYFLQAEKQLHHDWILMKQGLPSTPSQAEWFGKILPAGSRIGVDPMLISYAAWKKLSKELELFSLQLVPVPRNLVDLVWEDRGGPVQNHIIPLPKIYTGKTWPDKVMEMRKEMIKKHASALIITALDEVAWLFNLRGSDIPYNPVFFSYAVITVENLYLFVDENKLSPGSRKHLHLDTPNPHLPKGTSIELRPYKLIQDFVKWYVSQQSGKIWISNKSSYALVSLVPDTRRIDGPNPVLLRKAIKNSVEIENMRRAHIKDAVALCEFFSWLEDAVAEKKEEITEMTAAAKLDEFRKTQNDYVGPSFETISSSGPNAAVIHYRVEKETDRGITANEIYLNDSGAQFRDGTTDVTRTMHFGTPSAVERECFTRVVKGHISLATAIFPKQCKGHMLDGFARQFLWDVGLDYLHGTGHGVGMYLNVHEGPIGVHFRSNPDDPGLEEGMIISNEPGYYEDGKFGIRIESLVLVKKADTKYNFKERGYLTFETITLVPIQTKLLDPSLLTKQEIEWLDSYHQKCREVVGKALQQQGKSHAYQWLLKETQPLA